MTGAETVLVVDDSPDALSLIHDALEQEGMEVFVALEGKQGLTIAQRMQPDIVLLDAVMPQMDGFETCLHLKQDPKLSQIPVIFMTGLSDTQHIVKGLECGGVDYLTKPIQPRELIARMRVHLSNAKVASQAQQALDSTGQKLLTVDSLGQIQWATPQAVALFARAGIEDCWHHGPLAEQFKIWLQTSPLIDEKFSLQKLGLGLGIKLLGQQPDNHWLIKIMDEDRVDAALLRQQLQLTDRESEVLFWIANGKTNREAAEILSMSPRTVNKHLEQIFPKLGVENRTAAAGVALRVLVAEG